MALAVPSSLRSFAAEPAVPDAPVRVWRDWALVGVVSVGGILEAVLRTDADWVDLGVGWRVASVVLLLVTAPPALLARRTHPLAATLWAFVPAMVFGVVVAQSGGVFGGLMTSAVVLVVPYALYRWGSGRDGIIGLGILVVAGVVGNLFTPGVTVGDWIGGFIVLSIPVELGLMLRYRAAAQERAVREARAVERESIARELHDTVAHHVSAIAVQAQAGRALAPTDPERALEVLGVIEEAASRTLAEMRLMVRTLRDDAGAELAPQAGLADLPRLARQVPEPLRVVVDVDDRVGPLDGATDAAVYRIAREAVTNAVRHAAYATTVRVAVTPAEVGVRLTVTDDGVGSGGPTGSGFGLLGMTERAELLGGRLVAGPRPGRGWEVVADLPVDMERP
ncbi:MAG: sensor histidine kinase [Acidimicrobiales bacterium]